MTPDIGDTRELTLRVMAAIDGGACAIQYRNKSAGEALRADQAAALAAACRDRVLFIVNDDPVLAARVGADGVHVGEADGSIAAARAAVGDSAIIGVSCYNDLALAQLRAGEGADYLAFGSFFASHSKPAARRADPALLRAARSLGLPLVAIGGIDAGNAAALIAAGADAVAVISDVCGRATAADVICAAQAIESLFADTAQQRVAGALR